MAIYPERNGQALVIKTDARIDGANARQFQDDLQAAIEETDRTVVLDFENLTYISSAGIRVILLTAKTLQRREGSIALCSLSDPLREIFEISGFDKIIPIHATLADVLNAS